MSLVKTTLQFAMSVSYPLLIEAVKEPKADVTELKEDLAKIS
jgi:hypothetical protein